MLPPSTRTLAWPKLGSRTIPPGKDEFILIGGTGGTSPPPIIQTQPYLPLSISNNNVTQPGFFPLFQELATDINGAPLPNAKYYISRPIGFQVFRDEITEFTDFDSPLTGDEYLAMQGYIPVLPAAPFSTGLSVVAEHTGLVDLETIEFDIAAGETPTNAPPVLIAPDSVHVGNDTFVLIENLAVNDSDSGTVTIKVTEVPSGSGVSVRRGEPEPDLAVNDSWSQPSGSVVLGVNTIGTFDGAAGNITLEVDDGSGNAVSKTIAVTVEAAGSFTTVDQTLPATGETTVNAVSLTAVPTGNTVTVTNNTPFDLEYTV